MFYFTCNYSKIYESLTFWNKVTRNSNFFKRWKWRDIQPSMVIHNRNLCSAINPSKVHTHNSEHTHTHTHHEHIPGAVGSHLCCGEQLGFGALLKGTSLWFWGWRKRAVHCTFIIDLHLRASRRDTINVIITFRGGGCCRVRQLYRNTWRQTLLRHFWMP